MYTYIWLGKKRWRWRHVSKKKVSFFPSFFPYLPYINGMVRWRSFRILNALHERHRHVGPEPQTVAHGVEGESTAISIIIMTMWRRRRRRRWRRRRSFEMWWVDMKRASKGQQHLFECGVILGRWLEQELHKYRQVTRIRWIQPWYHIFRNRLWLTVGEMVWVECKCCSLKSIMKWRRGQRAKRCVIVPVEVQVVAWAASEHPALLW